MGLRDTEEMLDACKADTIRLERENAELRSAAAGAAPADEPAAPALRDSDLMFLAMRAVEEVARKMQRLEYDTELDRMLTRATELLAWAAWNIEHRRVS